MYRWAFDETSGTTAAETGKHGGDSVPATLVAGAIFTGVDLAAGKWGGVEMDGADDYVSIPAFDMSPDMSVSMRVHVDTPSTSASSCLFSFNKNYNDHIEIATQAKAVTLGGDLDGTALPSFTSSSDFLDNTCTSDGSACHIAFTAENQTGKLYRDGKLDSDGSLGDDWPERIKFHFMNNYIRKCRGNSGYFAGTIGDFCIYASAAMKAETMPMF